MSWADLRKKAIPEEIEIPTGPENSVQEEDQTLKVGPEKIEPGFDDNPFAGGDDEATAISAAQDLITTDSEKIKAVSNLRDPVAYALAHMQIEWERQEGADLLAKVDESLITNLEILENSRQGKDNRAKLFADAIKAINMQEFEMEKSTGNKLMGKS